MACDNDFLQPSCSNLSKEIPITPSILHEEKHYEREDTYEVFPSLSSNPALNLIARGDEQLTRVRPEGRLQVDGSVVKLFGVDMQKRAAAMVCWKERYSINSSITKESYKDNKSWAPLDINERGADEESSSALGGGQEACPVQTHIVRPMYDCNFCPRRFGSSQALGGHQNAHKRQRQTREKKSKKFCQKHKQHLPIYKKLKAPSRCMGEGGLLASYKQNLENLPSYKELQAPSKGHMPNYKELQTPYGGNIPNYKELQAPYRGNMSNYKELQDSSKRMAGCHIPHLDPYYLQPSGHTFYGKQYRGMCKVSIPSTHVSKCFSPEFSSQDFTSSLSSHGPTPTNETLLASILNPSTSPSSTPSLTSSSCTPSFTSSSCPMTPISIRSSTLIHHQDPLIPLQTMEDLLLSNHGGGKHICSYNLPLDLSLKL